MIRKISILFFCAWTLVINAQQSSQKSALLKYEARIDSVLAKATVEEKINMLHGKHMFVSAGIERLGIPDMIYADGPFGIREEMNPDNWMPLGLSTDKATFFPTGSALASTWSPELAYAYGTGMAREARLRGKDMILGPAINIQRLPNGGRTYEYLSEDPFLSARLAVAYTKGVQDNGVAVCLKHYALNSQELNRGTVDVRIGERAMREIYLPPFRAAVEEADAYGVMAAYNKVNGFWCAENDFLLNKVLRSEWGFAGMVISDWNGTHSTIRSVKSGLNVEMPGKFYMGKALLDSVKAGLVAESVIDQRVREILRVRFAIKAIPADLANKEITSKPEQQKIAYEVACKSIVMLKNEGILPIHPEKLKVIAVIGANATQIMATGGLGAGVKTLYEVTPLDGLKNRIGDKVSIQYAQGYIPEVFRFGPPPKADENADLKKRLDTQKLHAEALELAAKADLVIFIGGDNRAVETEGSDRKNIFLPSGQDSLLTKIAKVNQNIVTILTSGAPNDLNVVKPLSKALLISWFNGTEGGNALADVLTGTISPGGRLPFTLPVKLEDSPAFALGNYPQGKSKADIFANLVSESNKENKVEKNKENGTEKADPNLAYYSEESLVGYRWFDTKKVAVMYPFGYGLTYTTFEYSKIKTDKEKYGKKDVIKVSFEIRNTGPATADEVAQVYVHRMNPAVEWPVKELKAFSRIGLKPGESQTVTLEIPVKNLTYWDEQSQSWSYDFCTIELQAGKSSGEILLTKKVILDKAL